MLSRAVMGLGRHPQNDIVLDDRSLSRFHARVERRGDRFVVVDCGAQNGVHLNGERVVGESDLAPGDRITLGRYVAVFDVAKRAPAQPPKYDLNRPLPKTKNEVHAKNGSGGKAPKASSLSAELDALEVDVSLDEELDHPTRRAKHKDIGNETKVDPKKKPEPTLVLLFNGMEVSRHPIPTDGLTVGRSKQSDVVISLLGLSRKHAQIRRVKDGATVEDLGSQNGTWVNNQRISGQRKLKHGDLMNFYDYAVLYLEDGDVEVGFPGAGFTPPSDELNVPDDLSQRETNRSVPPAQPAKSKAPGTARSPVPLVDSQPGKAVPLHGDGLQSQSASELIDLGEGSYLGDEFEEEANAKNDMSSLLDEEPEIARPKNGHAKNGKDKVAATDVMDDVDIGSDLKGIDLDDGGFDGDSGTEGDQEKFNERTSTTHGEGARGWARDDELMKALSNAPDNVMVTLEVLLGGKPYTQMPLSQTVTRVGTDPRCELSLPKSSGLMAWHMTLMHLGGAVVVYRAARAGMIQVAGAEIDMSILKDGDTLDLGKVRVKLRIK